jgi:hypothetical protein
VVKKPIKMVKNGGTGREFGPGWPETNEKGCAASRESRGCSIASADFRGGRYPVFAEFLA